MNILLVRGETHLFLSVVWEFPSNILSSHILIIQDVTLKSQHDLVSLSIIIS